MTARPISQETSVKSKHRIKSSKQPTPSNSMDVPTEDTRGLPGKTRKVAASETTVANWINFNAKHGAFSDDYSTF